MGDSMDVDLDFKSEFYNLQGINIDERKKNFNKLLKSTSLNIPEAQIEIEPRNFQEKIFYVDVLIHFRKVDKLIDILKEGVGVQTSKILKQKWFFQDAFKNMSEEDIVNKFLPTLSYSLRMKVLKKLSLTLSEDRMGKIFDLIIERYGLFIAKQFLFSCSSEKIINVLKNNKITLSTGQLKRMLQKDSTILKVYFEECKKNYRKTSNYIDRDFLTYVALKRPDLCFEFELHKQCVDFGRFTTRAIIKNNKDEVLKDIENRKWNKAAITREIKNFDKECFHKFFPEDIKDINIWYGYSTLEPLVSKYPIKKRWQVLSEGFKKAYNTELTEHLDKFNEKLAKVFPLEIKQKWAEIKYSLEDEPKYLRYFEPKKGFKLIKEKINVTSDIYQRKRLLEALMSVCFENKDYSTFEEVLKYICMRHRNDDKSIRDCFIYEIDQNIDYNILTESHWKCINEIIDVRRIKGEILIYNVTVFSIIAEYLLFTYKNKLPLDGPVTLYAKDCIKINRTFKLWDNKFKSPEAESAIFKCIFKILPTLQLENKLEVIHKIISDIVDFNEYVRKDKNLNREFEKFWIDLNECEYVKDVIKEICTKSEPYDVTNCEIMKNLILYNCLYSMYPIEVVDEDRLLTVIKIMDGELSSNDKSRYDGTDHYKMLRKCILDVIEKPNRNSFENSLLDYFFTTNNGKQLTDPLKEKAIKHFLAKEPEVIVKYFSPILSTDLKFSNSMLDYSVIKKYSHLELDQKLISSFKDLVSVNSKRENKVKLLIALSKVMNTTDFIDLVKDYTPTSKKLDLNNDEQRELYQVQCDVVKAFKNLDEPILLAPLLMHFCQGDYLQSSRPALYSILYRINEDQTSTYINILGERGVSTRKHAMFLGFEVFSLKNAMTFYSTLCSKETNVSAKKYLFGAMLKFFLKNPFESLLDIVFLNMDFIDKNDAEMIEALVESTGKIPIKYAPLFIEKVWNYLDILEQHDVKVLEQRKKLVNTLNDFETDFMLKINKNFCESIIKKYFFSNDDSLQNLHSFERFFIINYLLAYLDDQHFEFIFSIIRKYKDQNWDLNDRDKIKTILSFFETIYSSFDKNDIEFLKLFQSLWQRTFNHEECFSEYVSLKLMMLYKENPNIKNFSKEVDKFFQEVLLEYGSHVSGLLTDPINNFFENIDTENNTDFNSGNFSFYLLEFNRSELNCFIAFSIVKNFQNNDQKEIYLKVTEALKVVNTSIVKIYYNLLLKKKYF